MTETTPAAPPRAPGATGAAPGARWRVLGGAVVAGVVAMLLALAATGAATPTLLADPGALVRWGLPVVELVAELAATVTLGGLVMCAVVLPRATTGSSTRGRSPRVLPDGVAWPLARRTAAVSSVVWTLALAVELVLTYARVAGRPLGGPTFGDELGVFLTQIELGRLMLWGLVLAAVTSLVAVGTSGYGGATWGCVLGLAAFVPVALTGHASGAANHTLAIGSMWLHLAGVTLWIGGLGILVLVAGALRSDLRVAATRFSRLAVWAYVLVAVSGVVNGYVRIGTLAGLGSAYGVVLLLKAGATVLLGVAGWSHRERTLPRIGVGRSAAFWRLVAGEVVLAGVVMGLAVALSNTAPPVPDIPVVAPTPTEAITGYPAPPAPTAATWLTLVRPDVLVLVGVVSAAVVVTRWTVRLRRRGDAWPVGRLASLLAGLALIAWVTSGGPSVYGHVLFSGHMVQHMVLVMLAPIFLVLGAPVTLALRALPARDDGSRGPRELLLAVVHSRLATFFGNPIVAAINVVVSMIAFYYTPLFELSLTNHLVHLWMIVHFTIAGYLFVNVLIGIDPGPRRPAYPLRLLLLFATMAFHAFFGLALTMGDELLAARWFGGLGLPWGVDALADQRVGGAFAWGFGELPSLLLAIALGLAWMRDDDRTARRLDRRADRDEDAELVAYNAMLARMSAPRRADAATPSDDQHQHPTPSPTRTDAP